MQVRRSVEVLRRTARESADDHLVHWAAALTYYALLSLFPGLLLLVAVLGAVGGGATQPLIEHVSSFAPGPARDIALTALERLQTEGFGSGLEFFAGLAGAMWAGSAYVGAFIPAANAIWEVEEARPFLSRLRVRIALTLTLLVLIAVTAVVISVSGPVARFLGQVVGAGEAAVSAWSVFKWPVLLVLVAVVVSVLYRVAPNVDVPHRRWTSPGSALAVVVWLLASAGFAYYVSAFGGYDRTYGAIAGVVVLLVWLWISNLALLLGVELNSELARAARGEGDQQPLSTRGPRARPSSSSAS